MAQLITDSIGEGLVYDQQDILTRAFAIIDSDQPDQLLHQKTEEIISSLLRRKGDERHRERTLAAVSQYFVGVMNARDLPEQHRRTKLRTFAREIVRIVVTERPLVAAAARATLPAAPARRRATDQHPRPVAVPPPARLLAIESGRLAEAISPAPAINAPGPAAEPLSDILDSRLAASEVEKPTAIRIVEPPLPQRYDSFRPLFAGALAWRLASVMRFFQRTNDDVQRRLVRPFLLAPEFENKLLAVVSDIIVPRMFQVSRNLALLETSRQWNTVSTRDFWEVLDDIPKARTSVTQAWDAAWTECRQRSTTKAGADGKSTTVLVAQPILLKIRQILAPDTPESYDLPPVRNGEIDLFTSLLYEFDLERLENSWSKLRQLYEQEMDRRWYQDKARRGALRDSLLEAFDSLPDRSGDFLALLCYFCFPNIDLMFLEKFTHNKGAQHEQRVARLPTLMRFLAGDGVEGESRKEQRERREREAALEAERKAARQEH